MSVLDLSIIILMLSVTIALGLFLKSKSSNSRDYFLGRNNHVLLLAASGSSSNYSVMGTIWFVSVTLVLGFKFFWLSFFLWLPLPAFLMSFTAIWIRRCGVVTSAELLQIRFGNDRGARLSRSMFALLISIFNMATLTMSYIAIYQFALSFGLPPHATAVGVIALTGVYVLLGGFNGVIWMDFIQTILMTVMSLLFAWLAYNAYTTAEAHDGIRSFFGTPEAWTSLEFQWTANLGFFADSGYHAWEDFGLVVLITSLVGLSGCFGGAGGTYGEQRFLAANSVSDAAKVAALWQIFLIPRQLLVAGMVFLAFTMFYTTISSSNDPDQVIPLALASGLLGPGLLGLFVAALVAAFMSTFSSILNAAASIVVRDLYLPFRQGSVGVGETMRVSYLSTLGMVVACILFGICFIELDDKGAALNSLWVWIMSGVASCYVIPLALRWYWGRMNGWGFFAGITVGLPLSFCILIQNFLPAEHFLNSIPVSMLVAGILGLSFSASIIGSLATVPVDRDVLLSFYAKVRPFGWWKTVEQSALEQNIEMVPKIKAGNAALNTLLGVVAIIAMYMAPLYLFGGWVYSFAVSTAIFFVCCITLYFSWYKRIPER